MPDPKLPIKKAAVIGFPISQSLSPLMHMHWFEQTGLEGSYEAIEVSEENLEAQFEQFKKAGYAGFNITVPHKTNILPFLDKLAPTAREMGAVNTVSFKLDGSSVGVNTDGIGFLKHLNETVPDWPKDRPVLMIGSGGAARAAALALLNDGVTHLMLCNRTSERAQAVANEVGRGKITVVDWADRHHAVMGAGLIVNTTTLGMVGQPTLDLDLSAAASDCVVYDIVYKPMQTDLLKRAFERGLKTVDGLGMLVHQGAAAFKLWFGKDVGFDADLRQKLLAALRETEKAES
ncbi:MAG: shikimate dehydrogenase [Kordiimonadaceae bacterium]|nr:shikimate dehydrogenase [Kordiimonadaceae bacterium]MBO6568354.1 shikimate dehydrogenase [Kordiimonadaceae bacterium]MBO6963917.1 shikimate dehydrogenase [Kordiimonadaceae bacterium]